MLIFLSVLAACAALTFRHSRRTGRRRLSRIRSSNATLEGSFERGAEAGILFEDQPSVLDRFGSLGAAGIGERSGQTSLLRRRLVHAGYRRRDAVALYTMIRVSAVLVVPVVAGAAAGAVGQGSMGILLCGFAGVVAGYVLPSGVLDRLIESRKSEVEKHLPSAIDLLAVSVDAGMGLQHGLARVADELGGISPVLADELGLVTLETSAGKTNAEAMKDLAQRVESREVGLLVNTLIQTERFGTSVSEALRQHGSDIREHRLQSAEERAGKAAVQMLMPTSLIMLSLIVMILGLGGIRAMQLLG